jgi:hypothetical protein
MARLAFPQFLKALFCAFPQFFQWQNSAFPQFFKALTGGAEAHSKSGRRKRTVKAGGAAIMPCGLSPHASA